MGESIFAALLDDTAAASGRVGLSTSVASYEQHRESPYGSVVRALRVRVEDLARLSARGDPRVEPLPISLAVPADTDLEPVIAQVEAIRGVRLEGVSIAARTGASLVSVIDGVRRALPSRVALAARVAGEVRARCEDCPSDGCPSELAAGLVTLIGAGVPVEVVGVDRAITDPAAMPATERAGVLNVLLAADAALDGAGITEVQQLLVTGQGAVVDAVRLLEPTVRRFLRAIGTPSLDDVVADLADLGLVEREHSDTRA